MVLNRIRIVLVALMIFGSFANFALNQWGLSIIILCQALIVVTLTADISLIYLKRIKQNELPRWNIVSWFVFLFLFFIWPAILMFYHPAWLMDQLDVVFFFLFLLFYCLQVTDAVLLSKRTKQKLPYHGELFEYMLLFVCFTGFFFKNMHWPGAAILLIFGIVLMGIPYYLKEGFSWFFSKTTTEVTRVKMFHFLLTMFLVMMGVSSIVRFMHWPLPSAPLMFTGLLGFILVLVFSVFKMEDQNGERVRLLSKIRIKSPNYIFVAMVLFIRLFHLQLLDIGVVPGYYESGRPKALVEMLNSESNEKTENLSREYWAFVNVARQNGYTD